MNVTDEWIFYKIKIYFKFVDLKIYLRLVAKIYLLRSDCFYKMPEHVCIVSKFQNILKWI